MCCGDGQKIYIPSIYDENDITYLFTDAGENVISSSSNTININIATQSELESIPGIGSSTAIKILEYRNKNGKFKKIEDIMNVNGIGESKFNAIKNFISI